MARTWSPARVRIRPRTSVTVTTPSRSCTPPTRSFRWLVITACLPYFLDKMGLRCHSARGPTPHLHHVHIRHPLSYHTPRRRGLAPRRRPISPVVAEFRVQKYLLNGETVSYETRAEPTKEVRPS